MIEIGMIRCPWMLDSHIDKNITNVLNKKVHTSTSPSIETESVFHKKI